MPIVNIQRRMAEQGRIRLGHKVTGKTRQGKEYTRPDKLDRFRFTSPNQRLIDEIAARYGGEARPWDNAGKPEFEVISDARSIPVIVVKGGFSQWYEAWTKAGCSHRCDGEKDVTGAPCDPDDPQHIEATAKPTTRLSVMLSEIETLGVWRMESKGWNAAAELPTMAELAMHVGDLVPATLSLAERSAIIETPKGPQTSRFVVPVLDLQITKARLVELAGGVAGAAAIEAGPAAAGPPALGSGTGAGTGADWAALLADASTADECRAIWNQAKDAGQLVPGLQAAITTRVEEINAAGAPQEPMYGPAGDMGEPVDAEVEDDGARDGVWMTLVMESGKRGITDSQLTELLVEEFALPPDECSAEQLRTMLAHVKNTPVPS